MEDTRQIHAAFAPRWPQARFWLYGSIHVNSTDHPIATIGHRESLMHGPFHNDLVVRNPNKLVTLFRKRVHHGVHVEGAVVHSVGLF